MNDFLRVRATLPLDQEAIYRLLVNSFPEFVWRTGDSDMQGPYISGLDDGCAQILVWLENDPVDVTLSFRGAGINRPDRQSWKNEVSARLMQTLALDVGTVIDAKWFD